MAKYGQVRAVSEFVGKLVPKRQAHVDPSYVHAVVAGVARLDALQELDEGLLLVFSVGGGIWVVHRGKRRFMIIPTQRYLRVLTGRPGGDLAKYLDRQLADGVIEDQSQTDYRQWRVYTSGLEAVWSFIEGLERAKLDTVIKGVSRHISAAVKQAAYQSFLETGGYCPGVEGLTKRHKLDLDSDRIEFDHDLPHSKGGSNTIRNIRILCEACNRSKSARFG